MGFSFFREHGWGTWDRLRTAPIRSIEIVGGKAISMLALNVCQQLILVALGIAAFSIDVPRRRGPAPRGRSDQLADVLAMAITLTSQYCTLSQLNAAAMIGRLVGVATAPPMCQQLLPCWRTAQVGLPPKSWRVGQLVLASS